MCRKVEIADRYLSLLLSSLLLSLSLFPSPFSLLSSFSFPLSSLLNVPVVDIHAQSSNSHKLFLENTSYKLAGQEFQGRPTRQGPQDSLLLETRNLPSALAGSHTDLRGLR